MEVDSVHSSIERICRHQDMYAPTDYYSAVRLARSSNPYEVTVLETDMFNDYKTLAKASIKNRTKAADGTSVNWLKVKWFMYDKNHPDKIFFKFNYEQEFKVITVNNWQESSKKRKMPRLKKLYAEGPKISAAKYNDLKSLCAERAIPTDYHPFYLGLKHDVSINDKLPETDIEDDVDDVIEY
jgi:hypothetical protein